MIKAIVLAAAVPFMAQHRNVVPSTSVSTNLYGSVTGIVTKAYVNALVSGVDTNSVKGIVDDQFLGGTQSVNRVVGTFDGVSNRVAVIEGKESAWDAKQDKIVDYTSTNAVCTIVTNNVADWAMAGKPEPQGMSTNSIMQIVALSSVTNGGAVAYADSKFQEKGNYALAESPAELLKPTGTIGKNINFSGTGTMERYWGVDYAKNADTARSANKALSAEKIQNYSASTGFNKTVTFRDNGAGDNRVEVVNLSAGATPSTNIVAYLSDITTPVIPDITNTVIAVSSSSAVTNAGAVAVASLEIAVATNVIMSAMTNKADRSELAGYLNKENEDESTSIKWSEDKTILEISSANIVSDAGGMTIGTGSFTVNDGDVYATVNETEHVLSSKANKATTLSGYGITNAYTKSQVDTMTNVVISAMTNKADKSELATYLKTTGGTMEGPLGMHGQAGIVFWNEDKTASGYIAGKNSSNNYVIMVPDRNGTFALTSDIPTEWSSIKDSAGNIISADRSFVSADTSVTTNVSKWTITSGAGPWSPGTTFFYCNDGDNPYFQGDSWTNSEGFVYYTPYNRSYSIALCGSFPDASPYGGSGDWSGYHAEGVEAWAPDPGVHGTITVDATLEVGGIEKLALEKDVQAVSNKLVQIDSSKAAKATTLAGYGITDAYTKSQVYSQTEADNRYIRYPVNAQGTATFWDSIRVGSTKNVGAPDVFSEDAIVLGRNATHWNAATSTGISKVFVWNSGRNEDGVDNAYYGQHGQGTFNINPYNGLDGFYVGKHNMTTLLRSGVTNIVTKPYVESLGIEAGVSAPVVTNISTAIVAPVSNVVFNSETYFGVDNDELQLVREDELIWKSNYDLVNYTNAAIITLSSGQIARQDLTSVTNISINLRFPAGARSAGDAMLRLSCASNSVISALSVNDGAAYTIKGMSDWNLIESGDTLMTFTKSSITNGVVEVWVMKTKSDL